MEEAHGVGRMMERLAKRRDELEDNHYLVEGHCGPRPAPFAPQLVPALSVTHAFDFGGVTIKLLRFGVDCFMDSKRPEDFVDSGEHQWMGLVVAVEVLQKRADGKRPKSRLSSNGLQKLGATHRQGERE